MMKTDREYCFTEINFDGTELCPGKLILMDKDVTWNGEQGDLYCCDECPELYLKESKNESEGDSKDACNKYDDGSIIPEWIMLLRGKPKLEEKE